jgi:hypothetical protein
MQLVFPGGGGGNWLLTLMHSLHTNSNLFTDDTTHSSDTFHDEIADNEICGRLFQLSHAPPSTPYIGFTTNDLWFSVYLNHYYKIAHNQHMTWQDELKTAKCTVEYILRYPTITMDINYSDVYHGNIPAFAKSLYEVLNKCNISYTKNEDIIYNSVLKYRSSIIDVSLHLDNYNSIPWIAWVLMVSNMFTDMSIDDKPLEYIIDVVSKYNDTVKSKMSIY